MARNTYGPWAFTVFAAGLGMSSVASLAGHDQVTLPGVAGSAVLGVAIVAGGRRAAGRRQLCADTVQALLPATGSKNVQFTKWRGRPACPGRVSIRYATTVKDNDPAWKSTVLDVLHRRFQREYVVSRHDPRRRTLIAVPAREPEAVDLVKRRVTKMVKELLGSQAAVKVRLDGDDLRQVEVSKIPTTKVAMAGYRARVERTFSAVNPGRWRCRWDLENDTVVFETRPAFPEKIWLPALDVDPHKSILATYDKVEIPFGVDEDGNVISWRPAIDPNFMVVGAPGTGKTALEHNILASITQYGWPVWVVDGKAIEFLGWRKHPNVQIVASTVPEQVAVITRAAQVMEHRYQLINSGRASEDGFEPLMLFVDEWSDFRANLLAWYAAVKVKGEPTKPRVLELVASIARKGRSARVHLLFATQRPDAEYFGGDMRDNFRCRASTGRLSPQAAMMMFQDPHIGTTVPRNCRGRATTIDINNRPIEIQTYWVPDPRRARSRNDGEALAHLDTLRPATELQLHPRMLIVPPDDAAISATSEYRAWENADWVLAAARPDLDPANHQPGTAEESRQLASPMAMFGIPTARSPRVTDPDPDLDDPDVGDPDGGELDAGAELDGYGPAIDADPYSADIGDLIEVEPGQWAVVDEEPADDSTGYVSLCWRDDDDNEGVLEVPAGDRITVRHTLTTD